MTESEYPLRIGRRNFPQGMTDAAEALEPAAPRVWAEHHDNLVFDISLGDKAATERAFADAVKLVSLTLVNQRVVANYIDTRGVVAAYDAADVDFLQLVANQVAVAVENALAASHGENGANP